MPDTTARVGPLKQPARLNHAISHKTTDSAQVGPLGALAPSPEPLKIQGGIHKTTKPFYKASPLYFEPFRASFRYRGVGKESAAHRRRDLNLRRS